MGWALIRKRDRAVLILFARGLSGGKAFKAAAQDVQFGLLAGDDIGQVLDGADQVGDLFLGPGQAVFHAIGPFGAPVARGLAARGCVPGF